MVRLSHTHYVKVVAALLLVASALLPLYTLPGSDGALNSYYPWEIARDDSTSGMALVLAYFWPLLVVALRHLSRGAVWRAAVLVCEPVLGLASVFILWLIPATSFGFAVLLAPWFLVPVQASLELGGIVAITADIVYLFAFAVGFVSEYRARKLKHQHPNP